MSTRPIIHEVIRDVVSEVKNSLGLPVLTFMFGTMNELISDLHSMSMGQTAAKKKYPLIWLPMDITERYSNDNSFGVSVRLIICHATDSNYTTAKRYEHSFTPVLQPIYEELLKQISLSSDIADSSEYMIDHQKTDRVHWGKSALISQDGQGLDFVDAIEIENLQLNLKFKNC